MTTDTIPASPPEQIEALGDELDALRAARPSPTSASATPTTSAT